jgi:WhiB family transcriptional regulator, redox-sensing transcriptional regulator
MDRPFGRRHICGMSEQIRSSRRVTIEQFEALDDTGPYRLELVRGELVREPLPGELHGALLAELVAVQPELARPMGSVAARKEIAVPEVSEPVRMVAPPRNRPRTNHYQASSDASPSTTSSPSGADGLWKDVSPRDDELVWQGKALCATADPDIFFPEKGASPREAKEICGRCEVTTECLRYAVENDEWFGIWGRHTARERRKYKKSRLP